MHLRIQQLWPIGKVVLGAVIVTAVGWRFALLLQRPELWQQPLPWRGGWLLATAGLYLLGLGFPAWFWYRLLAAVGEQPRLLPTLRAYYLGQLGKYVPGKAWGLLLRTGLLVPSGIRPGIGAMTTTFETLTTMASGALTAAVLFALLTLDETALWWSLGLLALAGLPIVPAVFNPLMRLLSSLAERAAQRLGAKREPVPLPAVTYGTLAGGVVLTACGWAVLGLSLWTVMHGMLPTPAPWSWSLWGRCTAFVALAWVAGFLSFVTPGGLGVREVILETLLVGELRHWLSVDEALVASWAVVVVLVLRLVWTVAEMVTAAVAYGLPTRGSRPGDRVEKA